MTNQEAMEIYRRRQLATQQQGAGAPPPAAAAPGDGIESRQGALGLDDLATGALAATNFTVGAPVALGHALYKHGGNAMSGGNTNTAALNGDAARTSELYDEIRQGPPTVSAQQIAQQPGVVGPNLGAAERVGQVHIQRGPEVQTGDINAPAITAATGMSRDAGQTQINDGAGQQVRGMQLGHLQALQDRAAGRGPSVADAQFKANMALVADEQLGAAAGARGTGRSGMRREAMLAIGRAGQQAALQSGMLKAQEQIGATGQLTGALSDVRGTDTTTAIQQAGMNQAVNLQNAQEANTTNRQNVQQTNAVELANASQRLEALRLQKQLEADNAARAQATNTTQAQLDASGKATDAAAANARASEQERLRIGVDTGNVDRTTGVASQNVANDLDAQRANQGATLSGRGQALEANQQLTDVTKTKLGVEAADKERKSKAGAAILGAVGTVGAGVATKSDRQAKTDVDRVSDEQVSEALRKIEMYTYRYKDPADGAGRRAGPMADDLLADPILRTTVRNGPDGMKRVDTGALSLVMAGLTARKLRQLEGRR